MFTFNLIRADGTTVDPPTFVTAVPSWREGETFLLRPGHVYRIVEVREAEDAHGAWVVEPAY
jgi:hypothetical protein